ncbi:MAG: hypothetical protein H0T60_12235 [Acidobacteria bacterium]|nr:hypothetical protein [Acidobacteriota bacterium]
MKRLTSSPLILILIIWIGFALGCVSSNQQNLNTNQARVGYSSNLNYNGVILSFEEQQRFTERIEAERKKRGLSDLETLKFSNKEWEKLLTEKRRQQQNTR